MLVNNNAWKFHECKNEDNFMIAFKILFRNQFFVEVNVCVCVCVTVLIKIVICLNFITLSLAADFLLIKCNSDFFICNFYCTLKHSIPKVYYYFSYLIKISQINKKGVAKLTKVISLNYITCRMNEFYLIKYNLDFPVYTSFIAHS